MNESLFTLHRIEGYIATIYLVEYPDRVLLLDGGARRDAQRIIDFFDRVLQRPPADLKLMLVSHLHPDHAGGAPRLRRRYGIPIAAHHETDRWYRGFSGGLQHLIDTVLGHYSAHQQFGRLERAWSPRFMNPDYLLRDGQTLPFFSDWQALSAPGHTLYDMAFYHQQEKVLYVGDLIIRSGNKMLLPFPTLFPELMAATLRRMSSLPVKRLLLAHGGQHEVEDSGALFTGLLDQIGSSGHRSFKLVEPLCSLGPDVRRHKKLRSNQD